MAPIHDAMTAAGRSMEELELVGGLRPTFRDDRSPADLDEAVAGVEWQLAAGYTTFCFNASQCHVPDAIVQVPEVPRTLSGRVLEVPVKRILSDEAAIRDALANPQALDWFLARAAAIDE